MFVRDAGAGPALLLLHALPYDSRMWDHQISELARTHRILAPDFPGFGRSPAPEAQITMETVARELIRHFDAAGISGAIVGGCSMGGYLAFALFRLRPEFFAGFALVDSRAAADSEEARKTRHTLIRRAKTEGVSFLLDAATDKDRHMLSDVTPAGYAAAQEAIARRPDSTDLLPRIRQPALVIRGTDDPVVSDAEARGIAAALPDCEFEEVPGAGHVPPIDQPEAVSGALRRLIGRCAGFS